MPRRARRSALFLVAALLPVAACFPEGTAEPAPAPLDPSRQQVVLVHAGAVEMRPGSQFLIDLNSDIMRLSVVPITSIWSPQDIGIQPPDSSQLPIRTDVRIPEACIRSCSPMSG